MTEEEMRLEALETTYRHFVDTITTVLPVSRHRALALTNAEQALLWAREAFNQPSDYEDPS